MDLTPMQKPIIQQLNINDDINMESLVTIQKSVPQVILKCIVCYKKEPKYKCPKCIKPYCSIDHYRSHNLFCSEKFYEQQVENLLKNTKVTDNTEKKKAVEMVKQFYQKIEQQSAQYWKKDPTGLTEEECEQFLKKLQNNQQVELADWQKKLFESFVDQVTKNNSQDLTNQATQNQYEFECQKLYWEIQDGLSMFWLQNPSIQEYNNSEYPEIIGYRHTLQQRIDQLKQQLIANQQNVKSNTSIHCNVIICSHILQLIYLNTVLSRAYDGESNQFIQLLVSSYCDKENQQLLHNPPSHSEILSIHNSNNSNTYIQYLQSLIRISQSKLHSSYSSSDKLLDRWFKSPTQKQQISSDIIKILKNKFLIAQSLYRILDTIKEHQQLVDKKNTNNNGNANNISSKGGSKKTKMNYIIVTKKIEYLIKFVLMSDIKNIFPIQTNQQKGINALQKILLNMWRSVFSSDKQYPSELIKIFRNVSLQSEGQSIINQKSLVIQLPKP